MEKPKQEILDSFVLTLRKTRAGEDIIALVLHQGRNGETVDVCYSNGYKKQVDVSFDSGIAMIKDIARAIS